MMQEMKIGRCLFLFSETNGQKASSWDIHWFGQLILIVFRIGLDYLFIHILSDLTELERKDRG